MSRRVSKHQACILPVVGRVGNVRSQRCTEGNVKGARQSQKCRMLFTMNSPTRRTCPSKLTVELKAKGPCRLSLYFMLIIASNCPHSVSMELKHIETSALLGFNIDNSVTISPGINGIRHSVTKVRSSLASSRKFRRARQVNRGYPQKPPLAGSMPKSWPLSMALPRAGRRARFS